jgi:REP element-mobilizing transposase RayT
MRQAGVAVYIHVVWATWDRLPLLVGEVEQRVHRAIAAKCTELGVDVIALGGVEDHVHLLVKLPPTVALAHLIGAVKGASSHLVTHEIHGAGQFFKWQGAYGAASVSPRALDEVSAYIAEQKAHHAARSLLPQWEPHISEP